VAAGGSCLTTATCVVVGPVTCGSGAICCMGTSTGGQANAADDATAAGCASGGCPEDAGNALPDALPGG
jgi:hypothetical protein